MDARRLVRAKLLSPSLHRELVIDTDNVNALDALLRELLRLVDVAGNLGRAWWGESARHADNDVFFGKCQQQRSKA